MCGWGAFLPFFLPCELRPRTARAPPGRQFGALPWDVAQSVRQRVVALPATAQQVLRAAAVVGRVMERAVLLDMVAQPVAAILEALDAACQARLLEEEGRAAYRFAHDVIREVIESDLSAAPPEGVS